MPSQNLLRQDQCHTRFRKVNDELARLESEGIITRVSHIEWASPIVPVVKSDNTVRFQDHCKSPY